ncbi:cytochrome-c peroxidase [Flavihumibacter sp. ZG627]|uniref:cytochrome-c peroxidase n=1 Tax=Flavihumibacter sp. ZG627 TaxID=1463156 RepID=UPI000693B11C|nr:cytochrome c peroxidase [Flavihumibacter sp. ZG627]
MRLFVLTATLVGFLISCTINETPKGKPSGQVQGIRTAVSNSLDSMVNWIDHDFIPLVQSGGDTTTLRRSYRQGRRIYKSFSPLTDYFYPSSARQLIGPALDEIEAEEHIVLPPGGFQVLEELLFDGTPHTDSFALMLEASKMRSIFIRLQTIWEQEAFRDDQVFDAIRMDIVRMATLQLSGFDAPVSLEGITEIPVTLQAYKNLLGFYKESFSDNQLLHLNKALDSAIAFVAGRYHDFNSFPRLQFISQQLNPLSASILQAQQDAGIAVLNGSGPLNMLAPHIFTDSSFRIDHFIPDSYSKFSAARAALGEKLFTETALSDSRNISCASCHNPAKAFTDALPKALALASGGTVARNTPTILYAGLQKGQFMDMRNTFLEDQAKTVIENKEEFHGDLAKNVTRLVADPSYAKLFKDAFPGEQEWMTERQVQVALASFTRSMAGFNSRFDAFMNGQEDAMSIDEQRGFDLFMGKAKCGTCHFAPVFNGTVPPAFQFTESEVLGVMKHPDSKELDTDPGRYGIWKIENFRFAFKTPTLRNISLTAPYMHHGGYQTLEEVMDFYNKGGAVGMGLTLPHQTLPPDPLQLTNEEMQQVIAFLHTLED